MQINRLFEMIYLLLDKDKVTAEELAQRFEVSTRTVYRDVETLSSGNIPIYMTKGKGGGISLHKDFVLNKKVFTEKEKSDILAGVQALSAVGPDKMDGAVKKLTSLFGGYADWVEVDFASWENSDEERALFDCLKNSILKKTTVSFEYRGAGAEKSVRIVEPLKLCFKSQSWYLYGFCRLRGDFRFFKLRRIKRFFRLDEKFDRTAPPCIFTSQSFNEKFTDVTLKIQPQMSYRVYDEFESYVQNEDGSFTVSLHIPEGDWIYCYIVTFGEYAEVLAPQSVREDVKNRLAKTMQNYTKSEA